MYGYYEAASPLEDMIPINKITVTRSVLMHGPQGTYPIQYPEVYMNMYTPPFLKSASSRIKLSTKYQTLAMKV